ncbi:MAG: hypothetical protein ACI9Z9_002944 [Litorivivens sp.]|jgi:hypothetical protein
MKYLDITKRVATLVIGTVILVGCNAADNTNKTTADLPAAAAQNDRDNDTIADASDNCPDIANVGQSDTDGDNIGDACDNDLDGDGVRNGSDNCPENFNPDQKNTDPDQDAAVDGATTGDACDPLIDRDQDGIAELQPNLPNCGKNGSAPPNCNDNCPTIANANQLNSDGDDSGNVCEDDTDQDGILDDAFGANTTCTGGNALNCNDNCINMPNADQKDGNWNSIGNACDDLVHCADLGGGDSIDLLPIYLGQSITVSSTITCSTQIPNTCTSANSGNVIDSDATNFTSMTVSDIAGQQSIHLSIQGFGTVGASTLLDIDNDNTTEAGRAGFVIVNPTTQFSVELASQITVATYFDGVLKESTSGGSQLQVDFFEQASVPPEPAPRIFLAISPITKDFNELRLTLNATAASAQLSRNIFGACYSNVYKAPPVPPATTENDIVTACRTIDGPAELCDGMAAFFSEVESRAPADAVAACKMIAQPLFDGGATPADPAQCDGFAAIPIPK